MADDSSPFGRALVKVVSREGPGLAAPVTFHLSRFRLVYRVKKCWLVQLEPLLALGDLICAVVLGICLVVFE